MENIVLLPEPDDPAIVNKSTTVVHRSEIDSLLLCQRNEFSCHRQFRLTNPRHSARAEALCTRTFPSLAYFNATVAGPNIGYPARNALEANRVCQKAILPERDAHGEDQGLGAVAVPMQISTGAFAGPRRGKFPEAYGGKWIAS